MSLAGDANNKWELALNEPESVAVHRRAVHDNGGEGSLDLLLDDQRISLLLNANDGLHHVYVPACDIISILACIIGVLDLPENDTAIMEGDDEVDERRALSAISFLPSIGQETDLATIMEQFPQNLEDRGLGKILLLRQTFASKSVGALNVE